MAKVNLIRQKISELLQSSNDFAKKDLLDLLPGEKHLIEYTLKKDVSDGRLVKIGSTRGAKYIQGNRGLISGAGMVKAYKRKDKSEEEIFEDFREGFLNSLELNENAQNIIVYAFTEMVNNAIDHSQSDTIEVSMSETKGNVSFTVRDFGIGAFKNIMEKKGLLDQRAALAELTKGKVTTAPKWHSGEGIFFTSRAADKYRLTSGRLTMERDNLISGLSVIENNAALDGTLVEFEVAVGTARHLANDVFGQFTSDPKEHDFGKTEISVKLFRRGDVHVSRSQAKRLMAGLDKFEKVVLDFEGVPLIGQGYADQVFRIFVREHPNTQLIVINACDEVQFMIDRVQSSK